MAETFTGKTIRISGQSKRVLKLRRCAMESLIEADFPVTSNLATEITGITGDGE